jgi:hypothetical protein
MRMDEQVEYNTGETFSLTPRLIAVKGERLGPVTVSTVFLTASHIENNCAPDDKSKDEDRLWETVKTVDGFWLGPITATRRGVNEKAT